MMPGTTCYGATVQNKLVLFTSPQGSHQHRSLHEGLYNDVDKPTIKSIRFRWSVHNISKSYRSIPAKKKRAYQGVEGKTRFDIRCDMFKCSISQVRYCKFDVSKHSIQVWRAKAVRYFHITKVRCIQTFRYREKRAKRVRCCDIWKVWYRKFD